jgi:hypothetical protein
MSFQITTAFVDQFHSNVAILSQQRGSRLAGAVRVESQVGEHSFYDQIGSVTAQKRTTRHGDTPLISTPHSRRRVTLVDYDWADLIDKLDLVKTLISPANPYALNAGYAFGRAKDEAIIEALFGDAYTGHDGSTTTSFDDTNNQVAVNLGGSAEGMTLNKLLKAKQILDGHDVDPAIPRYIALTARQMYDLLSAESKMTSADYATVKALVRGDINQFAGFTFLQTELLGVDANSYRRIPVWAKDGLLMAVGANAKSRITERADKNYSTQVFYEMSIGCTRMEETKVVEILCAEA